MQSIFKRYEIKYLITGEQYDELGRILSLHMEPDDYDDYLVQNLYYDTDGWDVIRLSLEKPVYKEKLRLRCYGVMAQANGSFLELKKKYKDIVYKRRLAIPFSELSRRTVREYVMADSSQIAKELAYYFQTHEVSPKIYISYQRVAFSGIRDRGFRVTFDRDLHFRQEDLHFIDPGSGYRILPDDRILMEIKTFGGMPVWLARALCDNEVFPTTFSKYGVCYTDYILNERAPERKELLYV